MESVEGELYAVDRAAVSLMNTRPLSLRGNVPTATISRFAEPWFHPFMANTVQARKRARQSEKQRQHNAALRSELRTALKKTQKAIATGDKAAAQQIYQSATSVVDRIADKKIIHKNKAARHKSRLAAQIKAMAAA